MAQALVEAESLIRVGESGQARQLLEAHLGELDCAVRLRELLIGEGDYEAAARIASSLAQGSGLEAHVSRSFLSMLQRDLRRALAECQQAVQINQDAPTVHNHAGRALHNAGQAQQAIGAFRQALSLKPDYPEAWHNLGHVLRAADQMGEACDAYGKSLELAPGYRSARLNLGKTLFNLDRVTEALACFEWLIERDPGDVEALNDAGLAHHLLGRTDRARTCYEQALASGQQHPTTYVYLAVLLNELQDADGAVEALQMALGLDPDNLEALVELAGTYELLNRLPEATDVVNRGLALAPDHPSLGLEAAKLARRDGRFDEALQRLGAVRVDDLPARLRRPYYFELGQVRDRQGDADGAFEAFDSGNRLAAVNVRRRNLQGERYLNSLAELERWVVAGAEGARPQTGDPGEDTGSELCFLHGFTRSGTTLLDMMLGAHPEIFSLQEVPTFEAVLREMDHMGAGYPASMTHLTAGELTRLRRIYRDAVAAHQPDTDRPDSQGQNNMIVDKMPMRFVHSGLIQRLFPDARILFALRHPCDVVLSNFMQQYPSTSDFLVNFDSIHGGAQVYDAAFSVWQKLEDLLDLPVEYLRYEDLVADPRQSMEQVCRFLGVPMADAMLDTSARMQVRDRVVTPSYDQVSEPLYDRAAERWQRYRRYLEPEFPLLEPHLARFGYQL